MANKGVTQEQVNDAADALVAAGERPTVERIRAFIGSGSPNTVTRLLEGWWQQLGGRLAAQQVKLALPEAPAEVGVLATQLWEQALLTARADAAVALDNERLALDRDRTALVTERQRQQQDQETQLAAVTAAQHALAVAEARLVDIQQLVEQQAQQIRDLTLQRDALQTRGERLEADLAALSDRLQKLEAAATTERESSAQHLRAAEDRAHVEIDRARQETKALRAQLAVHERERTTSEKQLRQRHDEAMAIATTAQREASAQRARAETLEQQLAKLVDVSALKASLTKARGHREATRVPKAAASKPKKSTRLRP